jgi:hypothetical protein
MQHVRVHEHDVAGITGELDEICALTGQRLEVEVGGQDALRVLG